MRNCKTELPGLKRIFLTCCPFSLDCKRGENRFRPKSHQDIRGFNTRVFQLMLQEVSQIDFSVKSSSHMHTVKPGMEKSFWWSRNDPLRVAVMVRTNLTAMAFLRGKICQLQPICWLSYSLQLTRSIKTNRKRGREKQKAL